MRGDDYVYTLPISNVKVRGHEVVNNKAAMLPMSLPYQPLSWGAITMYVDPKAHAMSTLYGNDAAIKAVRARRANLTSRIKGPEYGAGAVLALVTWAQREDPHWFGGRIPDLPQSVEFVQIGTGGEPGGYRRFAGPGLPGENAAGAVAVERTNFMLGLIPVQLP